ncbi:hypothetical protein RsTz2092_07940 [Deferribacterales bacterium RsTz2092]|nr:hypothetical protein AGMMS49941_10580 [Deferribacterales bacterium]
MQETSYKLSKEELDEVYNKKIRPELSGRTRPLNGEQPLFVVLAGQPGAGKTNVSKMTGDEIKQSGNNFVLADADNFRAYHPHYERAYKEQGRDASKYTHEDVGIWNERLIKEAGANGYNIITEGTLRNESHLEKLRQARAAGYKVVVKIIAQSPIISGLNIHRRFEGQLASGECARYVTKETHDVAVSGMLETLPVLLKEKCFDKIEIYDRTYKNNKLIYSCTRDDPQAHIDKATDVVRTEQLKPLTQEERTRHIADANKILETMREREDLDPYNRDKINKNSTPVKLEINSLKQIVERGAERTLIETSQNTLADQRLESEKQQARASKSRNNGRE